MIDKWKCVFIEGSFSKKWYMWTFREIHLFIPVQVDLLSVWSWILRISVTLLQSHTVCATVFPPRWFTDFWIKGSIINTINRLLLTALKLNFCFHTTCFWSLLDNSFTYSKNLLQLDLNNIIFPKTGVSLSSSFGKACFVFISKMNAPLKYQVIPHPQHFLSCPF